MLKDDGLYVRSIWLIRVMDMVRPPLGWLS